MQLHITQYGYLAHRQFSPKARRFFLTGLLLFYSLSTQSQTIIARWDFENKDPIADAGIAANLTREITSTSQSSINYVSGSGGSGSFSTNNINWDNGQDQKYWQISLSTLDYKNLNLSSKQYSSSTGPRDFKIQYSSDGVIWFDAGAIINVAANFTKGVLNDFKLPIECNNQPLLFIRWIMNSNIAVNSYNVANYGSNRIDDITINGCLMPLMNSPISHSCCSGLPVNYTPEGTATIYEWNRNTLEGISEASNSGSGSITETLTNSSNLPVNVNYTYNLDLEGCLNSQTIVVTVNPTPDLLVLPTSLDICPESGTQIINFSNPNQVEGTIFFWKWTELNSEYLSLTPSSGNSSPINISILNNTPSVIKETSVEISGTSTHGCSTNQLVTIRSGDNSPPIFIEDISNKNLCVQDIFEATSNGFEDITEQRPDYYMLMPSDNVLDLDPAIFIDNCTVSNELIIHWQLNLYQNPVSIYGTGQPSSTEFEIILPGNAENIVSHNITYWLEDKYGNVTPVGERPVVTITIHPRPPIIRDF